MTGDPTLGGIRDPARRLRKLNERRRRQAEIPAAGTGREVRKGIGTIRVVG